jgi:hypothetical protein
LVAHAHDLGYGYHRQPIAVGGPDGLIPLDPEMLGLLRKGFLAL